MAEYRESQLTGVRRMRAYQVLAHNPANGNRSIEFREEWLTQLSDGRAINEPAGSLRKAFDNPMAEFNLLHPETGDVVGAMSYLQVYSALHSLYLHLAEERDNIPPPELPAE
jgi:hypothetical protein